MEKIQKAVDAGIEDAALYTQTRRVPCQGDPDAYWADYYLKLGRKQAFEEVKVMLEVQSKPTKKPEKKSKKKTGDK